VDKLLAKSKDKDGKYERTVLEHCQEVQVAAAAIWRTAGKDIVELMPAVPAHLPKLLAIASLLHDVLKANSAFQGMVNGNLTDRQPVRHEILAAAFLTGNGPLATWFAQLLPNVDERWAVVWAIAGHHMKCTDPARNSAFPLFRDKGAAKQVTLFFNQPDVRALLKECSAFGADAPLPILADKVFETADDEEDSLRERIEQYVKLSAREWSRLKLKPNVKRLVAVLKALVIASDVAGSALTAPPVDIPQWIEKSLSVRLTPTDFDAVLAKDLGANQEKKRDFQTNVEKSDKPVTIVAAGCGNGKTTAAYLWAKKWANGKKLIFTYPTTGTATAGFIGYLAEHTNLPSDLIHGRSEVDLAAIKSTKEDTASELQDRIDSLRMWDRKIIVCTVDTVLGLFQAQRRGMYSFPAIASSAFIFDEIHSYDPKMFGGLLRFLKEFPNVPALLMSASIPPAREQQLRAIGGDRMSQLISGDSTLEDCKRYQIAQRTDEVQCWKDVSSALKKQQKVLWVCNTVGDAIRLARQAKEYTDTEPLIYHSRFRYRDRAGYKNQPGRQKQVIDEFAYHKPPSDPKQRVKPGPSLVITTQVCEMSLDISADMLVTAECPLPAFVQRLGRLNRYAKQNDPWPALVYPFVGLPYNEQAARSEMDGDCIATMKAMRDAVKALADKPCSQSDLSKCLLQLTDSERAETYSAWFDDGWVTESMPVRDSDQSITIIWAEDLAEIKAELGADSKKWTAAKLAPWTIPMPYRRDIEPKEPIGPYPQASNEVLEYNEKEGAQWKKN
jgi:CRISPR-associated endonuclease/helicase Cas3